MFEYCLEFVKLNEIGLEWYKSYFWKIRVVYIVKMLLLEFNTFENEEIL